MNKIDLSKNQLVEGDVEVWCWDDSPKNKTKAYLAIIDHKNTEYPFSVWIDRCSGEHNNYNYADFLISYKKVELIEPKYRVKFFYSLVETLREEGYLPCEGNDNILLTYAPEYKVLNWKKLFSASLSRVILTDEFIKEYNIQESWLEEVEE